MTHIEFIQWICFLKDCLITFLGSMLNFLRPIATCLFLCMFFLQGKWWWLVVYRPNSWCLYFLYSFTKDVLMLFHIFNNLWLMDSKVKQIVHWTKRSCGIKMGLGITIWFSFWMSSILIFFLNTIIVLESLQSLQHLLKCADSQFCHLNLPE